MFDAIALLEIHRRSQVCLKGLLEHCAGFAGDQIDRELEGFGYPTIRLQLHHAIGAQKYWIGVLDGRIDADEDDHLYPTIESLEAYRREVAALAEAYLDRTGPEELSAPCSRATWGGKEKTVVPALVFMRTVAHLFQHQGQVTAMCRLLGRPVGGLDFPFV